MTRFLECIVLRLVSIFVFCDVKECMSWPVLPLLPPASPLSISSILSMELCCFNVKYNDLDVSSDH